MDLTRFSKSLTATMPPAGLTTPLEALWWEAKGDWTKAHEIAQAQEDPTSSWVHAYLPRVEGDLGNASYWYRRAGRPVATGPFKTEWESLATRFLASASL